MSRSALALLVIDMQLGSFAEPGANRDEDVVVAKINALASAVRAAGGTVIFVQHDGREGDTFEPGGPGWPLLPALDRREGDPVVHKRACDAFCETELEDVLARHGVHRLLVTGSATDFCVDTTVGAAGSRDYEVTVVEDGHTTSDRPHLEARTIIEHHNYLWNDLILVRGGVRVIPTAQLLEQFERNRGPRAPG